MTERSDAELLGRYAHENSGEAFAAIVERHVGLVHSVALRHTSNQQHAEDITQAVFILLARKASSLGSKTILPGWLYHTARLTAANFRRAEARRVHREQEASMQSIPDEPAPDALWLELLPLLDDAMSRLGAHDRDALVLRFFQNKSLAEVGAAMGLEERTAQKRIYRALEKLRKLFSKRGVNSTTGTIAETISANSIQAVSAGLAATISNAALYTTQTATTVAAAKTMTLLQKAFATTATVVAVSAVIYALYAQNQTRALQQQQTSLQTQIQQLQQQLGDTSNQISSLNDQNTSLQQNQDELLRLRAEVTRMHQTGPLLAPSVTQPQPAPASVIQIHVKTRFYSIPDQSWQGMGIVWTGDSQGGAMGYLEASQLKNMLEALNGASDVMVFRMPDVVTVNGDEVRVSMTQVHPLIDPAFTNLDENTRTAAYATSNLLGYMTYTNLGETCRLTPFYSTNSSTFEIKFDAQLKQLSGDDIQHFFQTIEITNHVIFPDGQTLALEEPIPPGSWQPGPTNTAAEPKDLLILVTPDIVDSSGNLIKHP